MPSMITFHLSTAAGIILLGSCPMHKPTAEETLTQRETLVVEQSFCVATSMTPTLQF